MSTREAFAGTADAAVSALLEDHGDRIYRMGLRVCGNSADAEDLVQETFINAYRGWDAFRGEAKPTTWLYTIASRACQRMHRLRSGEPRVMESFEALLPDQERGVPIVADVEDPLDVIAREELDATVRQAVAGLPTKFRMPFVLREMGELPIAEIAQILGLKEATVKTRLHRARLAVRKQLVGGLPRRDAPHPDHARQECLDLLKAKQDALDRDVPFNLPPDQLCERCQSLFETLDLTRNACVALSEEQMPERLREEIRAEFAEID